MKILGAALLGALVWYVGVKLIVYLLEKCEATIPGKSYVPDAHSGEKCGDCAEKTILCFFGFHDWQRFAMVQKLVQWNGSPHTVTYHINKCENCPALRFAKGN